mgnify:CR=1 FL=1
MEMYRKDADGILCIRRLAELDLRTCIECAELVENGNAADKRTPAMNILTTAAGCANLKTVSACTIPRKV